MASSIAGVDPVDSPLSPSDGTSKRTTALSTKLTTVLSSSYADQSTRAALRILDSRGTTNTEHTRRTLKASAQRDVIDANIQVLDDFGLVAAQLRRVGDSLATLNNTVAEIKRHVNAARVETAPLLDEAETLLQRKRENEAKAALLSAFREHFIFSEDDTRTLTSSAIPLDQAFFPLLARLKGIHGDISLLFTAEHERLALELMESTTRTLNQAYQKLHGFVNRELAVLNLEDPHLSPLLRLSIRTLSERPALFSSALSSFAESRTSSLNAAFQGALTGAGGAAKAIEFSTHEPVRYVGDMLAWVHSAAVSEKEALEGLFVGEGDQISKNLEEGRIGRRTTMGSTEGSDEEVDQDEEAEEKFNPRAALSDLISRNLSLASQTLSSRVEVAVRSTSEPVMAFKIYNLLDFYRGIFDKLLGSQSALSTTISTLQTHAMSHFEETMGEEMVHLTADEDDGDVDGGADTADPLAAPQYLTAVLSILTDVLKTRGPNLTEAELTKLYSVILTPALAALATRAQNIPQPQHATIFQLNYTAQLHRTLLALHGAATPLLAAPLESARSSLATLRASLVASLASAFAEHAGISELALELGSRKSPAALRAWAAEHLDDYASMLDEFLASALMDAQDELKSMRDRTMAGDVVGEAVEAFCAEFEEVEALLVTADAVGETPNGEAGVEAGAGTGAAATTTGEGVVRLRDLYPRTGAEVRALLS